MEFFTTFAGLIRSQHVTAEDIIKAMENYTATTPPPASAEAVIEVIKRCNFSTTQLITMRRMLDGALSWDVSRRADLQKVRDFIS